MSLGTLVVAEEDEHTDKFKKMGYTIVVDPAKFHSVMGKSPTSARTLKLGLYFFIGELKVKMYEGTQYLTARAAHYFQRDGEWYADIDIFNVSNLVSSFSIYEGENGAFDASLLYNPYEVSLNDSERINRKKSYIESHVIGKPVEVTECMGDNSIKWSFSPVEFWTLHHSYQRSQAFEEYISTSKLS